MDQTAEYFTITLTAEGVNAVLSALGKLPTESEIYPLYNDIRQQAIQQQKQKLEKQ